MGFSDVDGGTSDVGVEVTEVENKDSDFGDGDGVNDFDETYRSLNTEGRDFCYQLEGHEEKETSKLEMSKDEQIDMALADFIEQDNLDEKRLPKSDGCWEGDKGNSLWIPDDDKIPGKSNPDNKSWAEIKSDYDFQGIEYINGEPDFSDISKGEVHIDEFTTERYKNFKQADECEAEKRGCDPEDVKAWRQENKYTWHERNDCETMDKVPSIVHNNIVHSGGISEKKKEIDLEDWL